jgi:hypothetical protein
MFFTAMSVMNGVSLHRQYQADAPAGDSNPIEKTASASIKAGLTMGATYPIFPWRRWACARSHLSEGRYPFESSSRVPHGRQRPSLGRKR